MRRALLLVLAAAVSGVVALPASPASACMGAPCDAINLVCQTVGRADCVG